MRFTFLFMDVWAQGEVDRKKGKNIIKANYIGYKVIHTVRG